MHSLFMLLPAMVALQAPNPDVVGKWQGVTVSDGVVVSPYSSGMMIWDLTLNSNGTFKWRQVQHVMVNILADATGSYTVKGSTIHLAGKGMGTADDGYKKSTDPFFVNFDLVKKGDQLFLNMGDPVKGDNDPLIVLFYRPGKNPKVPADLKPKRWIPKPSDPAAVALASKVEATYASLKSYSDEGTEKSNGDGYQPEAADFAISYERPDKLFFKSVSPSDAKDARTYIVWANGPRVWYSGEGSEPSETDSVSFTFGRLSLSAGQQCYLVPSLLIRASHVERPLSSAQILAKPDEVWDGKKCAVIELTDRPGYGMRITIDRSSFMILRIQCDFAKEEVLYHPHPNAPVNPTIFTPPSRVNDS